MIANPAAFQPLKIDSVTVSDGSIDPQAPTAKRPSYIPEELIVSGDLHTFDTSAITPKDI